MVKNFTETFKNYLSQCLDGNASEKEIVDFCNQESMHGEALVLSGEDGNIIILIRRISPNGIKNWWDVSNDENNFDVEDKDLLSYIHHHIEYKKLNF